MSESRQPVSSNPERRRGTEASERIELGPGVDADPAVQFIPVSETTVVPEAAIARRAYAKFVARGGVHGGDREDWTDAKNEILAEMNKS